MEKAPFSELFAEVAAARTAADSAAKELRAKVVAEKLERELLPLRQTLAAATKARADLQSRCGGMHRLPDAAEVERVLAAEKAAIDALEDALTAAAGRVNASA